MKKIQSRVEFAKPYLVALYYLHRFHPSIESTLPNLLEKYDLPRDDYFEGELTSYMLSQSWIKTPGSGVQWGLPLHLIDNGKTIAELFLDQGIDVTEKAEAGLTSALMPTTDDQIPASDRIVALDHNQATYRDLRVGLAELKRDISVSNDLGSLTADGVTAAVAELDQLESALDQRFARHGRLMRMATDTLKWIAGQAAGASVGAAALAVLALIGTFLGFY